MTDLKEYQSILANHDWFYNYSDDHRVWQAGRASSERIRAIAKESEQHSKLYQDYCDKMSNK